ncbi:DUF2007 domain-containing protein [Thalassolituus sp.]|jgi:hypothetical protein|uniref:putative signal transducing protein n=1 Tax=Thalassolituus sp. TaxID=2030822 RepID=UPI002A7F232C|nr:DUF2007 domain-containing protein [Thalassolituus sp.]|tara:strand:+ start:241 stop:1080 length:840 start_codon:yes stop_codon:yes gene_type:complete
MKLVYSAQNALDAQLAVDVLNQRGIFSQVDGAYLQGGMGELPALGLIRVMVSDDDFIVASTVISSWEKGQLMDLPETLEKDSSMPIQVKADKSGMTGILNVVTLLAVGCLVGVFATFMSLRSPVTYDGVDINGDGILDEHWKYAGGRASESTIDRNLDGKIDIKTSFDYYGMAKRTDADNNFDGVFETMYLYDNGNVRISKSDTNNDGFYDLVEDYSDDVLQRITVMNAKAKTPAKVKYYSLGRLVRAEVDTNENGMLDTVYEYDALERVVATDSLPAD